MTKNNRLLLFAVVLTACNLRACLTGIGPLSAMIQAELGLSAGEAGFITTIPLLAFAAASPFVGRASAKWGEGPVMAAGFGVLILGLAVRAYAGTAGLFLGTLLSGVGISVGNVLLPAMIKGCFPRQVSTLTGVYTSAMSAFASVAAAVSVPLAVAAGWKNSLAVWILLAAAALLVFLPFVRMRVPGTAEETQGDSGKVLRSPVTWWLSLYMGLQSMFFYCFVAWLPAVLQTHGFTTEEAGYWASIYQLIGIFVAFLTPMVCGKRDQRRFSMALAVLYAAGMGLMIFAEGRLPLCVGVVFCAICASATFSLAMLMISARASTPAIAAALSGVTQSAGYLIAAVGPFLMGFIFDMTGNWTITLLALTAVLIPMTAAAWYAGKDRYI